MSIYLSIYSRQSKKNSGWQYHNEASFKASFKEINYCKENLIDYTIFYFINICKGKNVLLLINV